MPAKKIVKDIAIRVLVTQAEARAIQAAADKDDRSVSAWARHTLLNEVTRLRK